MNLDIGDDSDEEEGFGLTAVVNAKVPKKKSTQRTDHHE